MEFATRAVHAGLTPDPSYGSVVPAIHQSSTYVQPAPGEFVEDYDYSRAANPTRRALENALGELEGGHATAFASGMAATHALLTAVCGAGDHVVLPDDLYGGTYRLVDKILARFGLAYDMVDQTDIAAVKAAMGDPAIMSAPISDVMEPPFNGVSTKDPVREAVELLSGDRQALTVTEHGRPVGIVTRADLLESLAS